MSPWLSIGDLEATAHEDCLVYSAVHGAYTNTLRTCFHVLNFAGLRILPDYHIGDRNSQVCLIEVVVLHYQKTPVLLRKFMAANFPGPAASWVTDICWHLDGLPERLPGDDAVQKEMAVLIADMQTLKEHVIRGQEIEERQARLAHIRNSAKKFQLQRLSDKRRVLMRRKLEGENKKAAARGNTEDQLGDMRIGGGIPLPSLQTMKRQVLLICGTCAP